MQYLEDRKAGGHEETKKRGREAREKKKQGDAKEENKARTQDRPTAQQLAGFTDKHKTTRTRQQHKTKTTNDNSTHQDYHSTQRPYQQEQ